MKILKVFLIMSIFLTATSIFAESTSPKVVVVGAGLAGLTTAYRLQQNGADVEVYEARNRVGGRVLSVNINGAIGELGGQSITDGGEAKTMRRLIDEFGLELEDGLVSLNQSYWDNF